MECKIKKRTVIYTHVRCPICGIDIKGENITTHKTKCSEDMAELKRIEQSSLTAVLLG
jgi:hypothetical protein